MAGEGGRGLQEVYARRRKRGSDIVRGRGQEGSESEEKARGKGREEDSAKLEKGRAWEGADEVQE
jgi:hypothetical protein